MSKRRRGTILRTKLEERVRGTSRREHPAEQRRQRTIAPQPTKPTRADLERELEDAREDGDRERVAKVLARLMMTPRDTPPGPDA